MGSSRAQPTGTPSHSHCLGSPSQPPVPLPSTIQALLKEFANAQEKQTAVKEEVTPPPSPRSNGTLTAHPTKDELIYFGGEHFDGKTNRFFAELYRYIVSKSEWRRV